MAKLRWGSDAPADTEDARQRLIDAAEYSFKRYGVVKTTVEDVAKIANVSRATVYRYFKDRDELILGVLLRDAGRFLDKLAARVEATPGLAESIISGVLFTVKTVQSDENLALLFAPEVAGITTSIAGASEALFRLTAEFLRPYFTAARETGSMRTDINIDDAAEWTLRTILSLVTVDGPRPRTEAQLQRFLRTFLVPALTGEPTSRQDRPETARRKR